MTAVMMHPMFTTCTNLLACHTLHFRFTKRHDVVARQPCCKSSSRKCNAVPKRSFAWREGVVALAHVPHLRFDGKLVLSSSGSVQAAHIQGSVDRVVNICCHVCCKCMFMYVCMYTFVAVQVWLYYDFQDTNCLCACQNGCWFSRQAC